MAPKTPEANRPAQVSIGEALKEAREKRNMTLDQVQKQTRIHTSVLTALEDGRVDDILNPTYAKSFLKEYARYLGLDHKKMLEEYSSGQKKIFHEEHGPVLDIHKKKMDGDYFTLLRWLILSAAVMIAVAFLAFVLSAGARFVSSVHKDLKNKNKQRAAKMALVRQPSFPGPRNFSSAAKPKARAAGPTYKYPRQIIPKDIPLYVVLKIKAPVWIELKRDGEKIFQRVLPKGLIESVKADERINLYIANGDSVEIVLNGRSYGSPGRGIIKNLEITRNGIRTR